MTSAGRTLIVRADSGPAIGAGHVSRMGALAEAWRAGGGEAILVGRLDIDAPGRWPADSVTPLDAIHPLPGDLEFMTSLVSRHPGCCVACDGYHFDAAYTDRLRSAGVTVLQMEDTVRLPEYRPDVLVNQNSTADPGAYRAAPWTRLLFGPAYALLRSGFSSSSADARRERSNRGTSVLVTLGGGRRTSELLQLIALLDDLRRPDLSVSILPGASDAGEIERSLRKASFASFAILTDPDEVPTAMRAADVAISAAGSTSWELCQTGTPQLLVTLADNQRGIAADLAARGIATDLGGFTELDEAAAVVEIGRLVDDRQRRVEMSRRGRLLVDGYGAARVATALESIAAARSNLMVEH